MSGAARLIYRLGLLSKTTREGLKCTHKRRAQENAKHPCDCLCFDCNGRRLGWETAYDAKYNGLVGATDAQGDAVRVESFKNGHKSNAPQVKDAKGRWTRG